ncbi:outer membrane beta-barrel protein [Sulfurimonas sp.]|uniref:outer membrane beta-barrel protein n=1 Tax=Sulfurimonas sp. TaxID=2022749 RepID=UPI001A0EB9A5|nr:outer membrane beta-barrel protein [Sulfurimonas sp.]MBE0514486.1 OmpA family protein [Sulfurimonas sp.]
MRTTVIRATKTASFLLLATLANPLFAQTTTTENNSGWYIGANIGMSTANVDEGEITKNLTNPSYSDDESDFGYKLFGGYLFNKNFALEGGYFDLGKFDYSLTTGTGTAAGDIDIIGLNLDAVGILPITEDFSAFGRVGVIYAKAKDSFSGSLSIPENAKESDFNYKFGAGLQYAITDAVAVRLEAERYRINDAVGNDGDIDLFSIGLTYRFGATKESAPVAEKEEEVIAPVAEKEVVVVPVMVVAETEEEVILVCDLDAKEKIKGCIEKKKPMALVFEEINFEFDKSELNQEAKRALKKDLEQLKDNSNIRMIVAGYASKSGTKEYNQKLSEERAQSVKDFLVQEKILPANKISTVGYGETRPAQYEANPESDVYSKAAKANMRVVLKIVHE